MTSSARWMRWFGVAVLVVWVPSMALLGGLLLAGHLVAMPSPSDDELLVARIAELTTGESVSLVHVIYEGCSCTNGLVQHLLDRRARPGEQVLFVGAKPGRAAAFEQAGFAFRSIDREELVRRWAIPAAPVLVAVGAQGQVLYVGGYYRTPATVHPQDQVIRDDLLAGRAVAALPVFGCPVDAPLQRQVDPLGLLY